VSAALKKILPSSLREALFSVMTFCNVGVTTFFVMMGHYPEAAFSCVTSLLCFGMWVSEINKK
tara:strand:+ start:1845 stop:2033 length:189 start_codon:yes stop_codon:yes gene_type:complete